MSDDVWHGRIIQGDCLSVLPTMPADSVDLVFGSPPYADARLYLEDGRDLGVSRDCQQWVAWMLEVSEAAARVCRGPVFWVVAGVTRDRCYWPGPEGLAWEWWKRGGEHHLYRPCVFHRVGIPGSGGKEYLRADWEYVLCLKRPGTLPWADNKAMGHPPRWALGGEMSNRQQDGKRANDPWQKRGRGNNLGGRTPDGRKNKGTNRSVWGGAGGCGARRSSGKRRRAGVNMQVPSSRLSRENEKCATASKPAIANPGNVLTGPWDLADLNAMLDAYETGDVRSGIVGGGVMGHPLAHENEAPFPEWLAEFFVRTFCPEGGIVLDPFCGSGTTLDAARKWGRNGIGIDLRDSQVRLTKERLAQGSLI